MSQPLGGTIRASSQTDIPGLLPQNKKAKERGFFTSCLATQGGEKTIRDMETALGGSGVQGAGASLRRARRAAGTPCCRSCARCGKGEQEKHGGLSNAEPRLGPGNHSPPTPQLCGVCTGSDPSRASGPLCARWPPWGPARSVGVRQLGRPWAPSACSSACLSQEAPCNSPEVYHLITGPSLHPAA